MLSLQEMCVRVIYQYSLTSSSPSSSPSSSLSLFSSLPLLPVELVDQVFSILSRMTALSDSLLYFWKVSHLREFDFSSCKYITDQGIKEFVQRFPFLESLKLGGESGVTAVCIPYVASHCTKIRSLDISDMPIKDNKYLESLKKCGGLRTLVCKKNSGLKAKVVGKLLSCWPNLNVLDISGIEYGETIFANIPSVKTLTHLYCGSFGRGNNKATTESIQNILDNCPSLVALDISGYLMNICTLRSTRLQSLDISYTVVDASPDTFLSQLDTNFPRLEHLRMEELVAMKGLALTKLATNTTLRELDFSKCISMDSGCVERWGAAAVAPYSYSLLSLSGCKDITDASFSVLAGSLSASLHTLNLSGVWKLDKSLEVIADKCPNLTALDLSLCKIMSTDSIIAIAKGCPFLKSLELYSCKNVTDDAAIALAENCPELTLLNLYGLPLTDRSVVCFGQKLHNLTSLDCSCTNISDESLRSVGAGCPLSHFSSIGCQRVTDHGVSQLVRGSLFLQRLVLNDCKQLTDTSLREMARNLRFLRDLSMLGCTQVSGEGVLELGRRCRTLRTLRLSSGAPITTNQIRSLFDLIPHLSLKL